MAYIYKKNVGGKPYYYLRISKRINSKVVAKDIAYLGNNISEIQKKLDALPKKHQTGIRKGYRNIKNFIESNHYLNKVKKLKKDDYLDEELHRKVEATRLHFQNSFLKNHDQTIKETYESFLVEFAYNTTSIEGNTITLKEAAKLLLEDLTPKERTPREIFDLQNTRKVFFYLLEEKPIFNEELIIKIHDSLLENIDVRKGYRNHEIRVFKSRFKASEAKYVQTDIKILFKWYKIYQKKLHPLALACLFHQKFEKIHPFSDGNGRTGRMIMNYILFTHNYPFVIIQKEKRSKYLDALSKADKADINNIDSKYFKNLVNHVATELIESYWECFNI